LKLLLDTHAALWFLSADDRLGEGARRHLYDADNRILLSAAVVLEVAVKRSLGKLTVTDDYLSLLLDAGAQSLPISLDHAAAVERLPWHHRDPFDRLLVAQAEIEQATLVSRDSALGAYGVPVIW
jgi:PIN domain nuclease of toxin-antitoxin system